MGMDQSDCLILCKCIIMTVKLAPILDGHINQGKCGGFVSLFQLQQKGIISIIMGCPPRPVPYSQKAGIEKEWRVKGSSRRCHPLIGQHQ